MVLGAWRIFVCRSIIPALGAGLAGAPDGSAPIPAMMASYLNRFVLFCLLVTLDLPGLRLAISLISARSVGS